MLEKAKTHGQRFGEFGASLSPSDIPSAVIEKLKLHLIDAVAVSYAFVREPLAAGLIEMATRGNPKGVATIIGSTKRTSAQEAAFVNGALAHGKDFDDVHIASITHPSVVVAPAVLALAEARGGSGQDILSAAAFGIEVCIRLGLAGGTAMARRGIPPMTTCGALAAAAGAAKALDLDAQRITAAIGLAGSFASGSHEWTSAGTNAKLTTPGWAARSGVITAVMAEDDFDGSLTAIEGRKGLLVSMAGPEQFDETQISTDLGDRWEMLDLVMKRSASCQGTQPYIEASLKLLRAHEFNPEDIQRIEVVVGQGVGATLSEPADLKRDPPNPYAAKFSIPFCVALALKEGRVSLAHFEQRWPYARQASALAQKVHHKVDPAFDEGAAERGLVRIELKNGRLLEAEHRSSGALWDIDEIAAKFAECADGILGPDRQARIIDAFLSLDRVEDMGSVMSLLVPEAS